MEDLGNLNVLRLQKLKWVSKLTLGKHMLSSVACSSLSLCELLCLHDSMSFSNPEV